MLREQLREIPPHMLSVYQEKPSETPAAPKDLYKIEQPTLATILLGKVQAPVINYVKALQNRLSNASDATDFIPKSAKSRANASNEQQYLGKHPTQGRSRGGML